VKYSDRFESALVFATQLHDGHRRKATDVPYVTHLLAVASLVGEAGGTENEVIAALLHDAVEDCGGQPTLDKIREMFGDDVAQIVLGCSDTDETPKPPWKQRKEAYIQHVAEASESILLVSCADKLHNARCILADFREIGDAVWDKFAATKEQTLWYYRSLLDVYQRRGVTARLVNELDRTVSTMEELAGKSGPMVRI
jgi:(p)ppGpp synthase/HD superfamily hydrolase